MLQVSVVYSNVLWPWSGWLAVYLSVSSNAADYTGTAQGHIELTVESPSDYGDLSAKVSPIKLPIRANIIPTPPKQLSIVLFKNKHLTKKLT